MQELGPHMEVVLVNQAGMQIVTTVAELLPYSFQEFPQQKRESEGEIQR